MRTSIVKSLLAIPILILLVAAPARADSGVHDPVGDFLSTLSPLAPRSGDLDVVRTRVSLIGTDFIFSAKLNGNIGTTPENRAFYAWGVDRGLGASTRTFASLGLPNIVFDAVVGLINTGTPGAPSLAGAVTLLAPSGPPVAVNALPPENITISNNTFQVVVPAKFLPSQGFALRDYGQNLWPRWRIPGVIGLRDDQISDFAPDDRNARVSKVEQTVRWDIIHLLPPNNSPGGEASALANDPSKITLTGSGTFEIENREIEDVTGGGTWETFDQTGMSTGSGTYRATKVVRFTEAPGTLPSVINDGIGNRANVSAGLLVLSIIYSDGSKGILVLSCDLVGTPSSVFEGITASKGFLDYWNRVAPVGGVDANRTLFHITSKHED